MTNSRKLQVDARAAFAQCEGYFCITQVFEGHITAVLNL